MRPALSLAFALALLPAAAAADAPWPAPVPGFTPPAAGEHPRLFFRKADVPALRERAATPDGKLILARCKTLLGIEGNPERSYTLWHGAAAGFLYQATGDAKYAALGKEYVQKALDGALDSDKRYAFVRPSEPLRAGPSLAAVAVAYDLCYDGWDDAFRKTVCGAVMNYNQVCGKGAKTSLEALALRPNNPNPVSNHLGLQTGGAGLAVLAIKGDPGADDAKLAKYQEGVERFARKILTEDFGEGGYFGEHAGPGVIASTWTFLPWLQAERVCGGRDWLTRPNAEWITLRFAAQTVPTPAGPMYTNPAPMGGYGTDQLVQDGGHHAAYFCEGFGAVGPEKRAALLWVYEQFVRPTEAKLYPTQAKDGEPTFDAFTYPHRAMFALVNWPWGVAPANPEGVLPKVVADRRMGQYVFRNRWKDADDAVVAVLFGSRTEDKNVKRCMVWGLGHRLTFGDLRPSVEGTAKLNRAKVDAFDPREDGSGAVTAGGTAVGVDYSRASGADAVVVQVGPGATGKVTGATGPKVKVKAVTAGGATFSILTLAADGTHPEAKAEGDAVTLGKQTIRYDGKAIVFGTAAGPLKLKQ